MVAYNKELGITDVGFVLDRGFCSTASVKFIAKENLPFILGVEKRHKTTIKAIDFARENILSLRYLTSLNVQAIAIQGCFYGVPAIMHIYFDPEFSKRLRWEMRQRIELLESELSKLRLLSKRETKR
jgi:transposase